MFRVVQSLSISWVLKIAGVKTLELQKPTVILKQVIFMQSKTMINSQLNYNILSLFSSLLNMERDMRKSRVLFDLKPRTYTIYIKFL